MKGFKHRTIQSNSIKRVTLTFCVIVLFKDTFNSDEETIVVTESFCVQFCHLFRGSNLFFLPRAALCLLFGYCLYCRFFAFYCVQTRASPLLYCYILLFVEPLLFLSAVSLLIPNHIREREREGRPGHFQCVCVSRGRQKRENHPRMAQRRRRERETNRCRGRHAGTGMTRWLCL